MITFSKISSSSIVNFFRSFKVKQFGVKTADHVSSFGDDSAPLKDMVALFAETSNNAEPVVIGFINKNQLAQPGEKRIFSLQSNGALSADIYLKSDGTIEFHGNQKNMVRYQELETAFNELNNKFNALVIKFNAHSHAANGSAPPATPAESSTADIAPAKIDNIKTN